MNRTAIAESGARPAALRRRGLLDLLVLCWLAWAIVGLFWTPVDPEAQAFRDRLREGPSAEHWLGIDSLGRDVLSRVWRGSGHTVLLGLSAALGSLAISALLLLLERSVPVIRAPLRSLVSAGLAFPVMFVGLILLVFLPASPWTLVVACALGGVPLAFRQLHVIWVEQAGALHVLASRALGGTRRHLASFAIWPNVRGQVVALGKLLFAVSVLELSGLAFLGLTGDPDFTELGAILRRNQADLFQQPLLVVWPGVLLSGLLLLVHLSNVAARDVQARRT